MEGDGAGGYIFLDGSYPSEDMGCGLIVVIRVAGDEDICLDSDAGKVDQSGLSILGAFATNSPRFNTV